MVIANRYEVPGETRGGVNSEQPMSESILQCKQRAVYRQQLRESGQFSIEAVSPERPSRASKPPNSER